MVFSIFPSRNFEQEKTPRKLEHRSHLSLEFPQSNNRVFRTYIPFLENPKISEAGSNTLQEYNLIGRAGSLYSYGGSESRAFDVTFNISLLHLLHLDTTEGIAQQFKRNFNLFFSDKESAMDRFQLQDDLSGDTMTKYGFEKVTNVNEDTGDIYTTYEGDLDGMRDHAYDTDELKGMRTPDLKRGAGFPHAEVHRNFYAKWLKSITGQQNSAQSFLSLLGDTPGDPKALNDLIDLVFVWVNLVRATCLNNARNTVQGPPIVRLTHGPMYNNIPCVVRDYTISIMDEVGFEVQTLTPKRLEITLTLSEMRTGDFGTFESGWLETGDNLAGWEAIIEDNNTDPYNGDITEEGIQIGQNAGGSNFS
jgi:hypothetical protein